MIMRLRAAANDYPRQFWALLLGMLVQSIGGSMVWPFLTILVRERLAVSLTTVTLLFTLNSASGLLATSLAGPAVDRFGRKRAMLLGLAVLALALIGMSTASTLAAWVALMALQGVAGPLYRVGSDAMVADLIEPERRVAAYALIRMSNNLGIAIGPAIGGFVAAVSYRLAFYGAAASTLFFLVLIMLVTRETLGARHARELAASPLQARDASYAPVLRDRWFLAFCGIFIIATIPTALLMMLLAVYAKENFGVPESQYGFIMATNAVMVVLLQVGVTRWSRRRPHLYILALGALLYGLGAGSVALGRGFWAFWLSMVILTFGELLLAPTGTAYAANLAPPDMRGRYMGLYGLTWSAAFGIGPVMGGWLSDHVAPEAIWLYGLAAGLLGMAGFLWLARRPARDLRARGRSPD